MSLDKKIEPFWWNNFEDKSFSVCLNVGEYKEKIFESRGDEGFEGNGYDWTSLARVFLDEKASHLSSVKFDPEGGMFSAYSSNAGELEEFILSFKSFCEDELLMLELFSRAELD